MADIVTTVTAYVGQDWTPSDAEMFESQLKNLIRAYGADSSKGIVISVETSEVY